MDAWLVTLIGIQMAFMAVLIVLIFRHKNAQSQRRAELQARLIEKFESPSDLSAFLASAEGHELMGSLAPKARDPRASLASGVKAAIVLFFLGLGFSWVAFYIDDHGLLVPGFICVSLSVGVGLAAIIGHRLTNRASSTGVGPTDSSSKTFE